MLKIGLCTGALQDNEGGDSHERIEHGPHLRRKGRHSYEF